MMQPLFRQIARCLNSSHFQAWPADHHLNLTPDTSLVSTPAVAFYLFFILSFPLLSR